MDDTPSIDELKEQESVEITIEEEDLEGKKEEVKSDVSEALRDLGRQFAETIQAAWNSQERREFEEDVREGVEQFADEVQKVFREAKESPTVKRVKEEANEAKEKVETKDVSRKARASLVDGLQWLSQELGRLAEQFSPPAEEKTDDIDVESEG
jgi:hypothetical protein